ncbi:MAG: FecR domain-containing protein [Deltaproteobacteria bacterium]|nr:FecR domain-containing protein [Deltaproteobacteria bacterium]
MKKICLLFISLFFVLLLNSAFQASTLYAQPARGAAVPVESLPEELQGVSIKDYFIPSSFKEVGIIHSLNNSVVVIHRATNEAYFGRQGDVIYENDLINSLTDSRCRIKFYDEDVISLAADTSFSVDEYSDNRETGQKRSLFSITKGKAMFYAMRLFKYKESRFDVKTPTAVAGVRGTKFGIHVYEKFNIAAGTGIRVADAGNGIDPSYLAQASGSGSEIVTVVTTGDGLVVANGISVNPGEVYTTETNEVVFDPTVITEIETETEVQVETGDITVEGEGETTEGGAAAAGEEEVVVGAEEFTPEAMAQITEITSDTTTQETGASTEGTTQPAGYTSLTAPLEGYFTALLTHYSTPTTYDVYLPYDRLVTRSESGEAYLYGYSVSRQSDMISLFNEDGQTYGYAYLDGVYYEAPVSDFSTSMVIAGQVAGSYQWGYSDWSSGKFPDPTIGPYAFDNRIWFIEGYHTPIQENWPSGPYQYGFNASGTYWSQTGGLQLSGSGSSNVYFMSSAGYGTISDFELSAETGDGNYGARITQPGPVGFSDGQFKFDHSSGGAWELKKGPLSNYEYQPGATGRVSGSFFGDNADIGFAWGVYCPVYAIGAGGIGHGPGSVSSDISAGKVAEPISGISTAIVCDYGFAHFARDASNNIIKGPIYEGGPNVLPETGACTHVAYESQHYDEVPDENLKMVVQEISDTSMDMNVTYFDWGSGTNYAGNVTPPHTFKWYPVGSFNDEYGKEYMSWGYWKDTATIDTGLIGSDGTNNFYAALGRVYEVEGYRTHPDYIKHLQNNNMSATYSNSEGVGGVYVSSDSVGIPPTDLSGGVSFDVNFGTMEVANFYLYASGQNSFSTVNVVMDNGYGTIDSTGEFDLMNQNFSSILLNGSPADGGGAGGVFTGPKANGAAGGWEVIRGQPGQEEWATGGFVTQRGELSQP